MKRFLIKRALAERVVFLALAAALGEEAVTLEDVYEPYLLQIGFLTRTPRGRCVTRKAYEHLHIPIPGGAPADMDQLTL